MNQGWQYNFYNPGSGESSFRVSAPGGLACEATTAPVQPSGSVGLKVFSPANKRDFVMLKLREVSEEDFATPTSLRKVILKQAGSSVVSADLSFPLGFFSKSDKFWINNELDMKDVKEAFKLEKLTLWCVGKDKRGKKRKDNDSDEDSEGSNTSKKKRTTVEERGLRVEEIKNELRQKHGSSFSGVQYALWAEMVVAGTHESKDSPPPVPMFGSNRPRHRSNRFEETLAGIVNALSPPSSSGSSPSKAAELRGKYIHQLKELVDLRELGALTESEYQEHRLIVVNLMKKL